VWDNSAEMTVPNLLDLGYRIIISNSDAWYLDCGFGDWISGGKDWCSPYKGWQIISKKKKIDHWRGCKIMVRRN